MSQPPATVTINSRDELERLMSQQKLYFVPLVIHEQLSNNSDEITLIAEQKIQETQVDFLKTNSVQLKSDTSTLSQIYNRLTNENCVVVIDELEHPNPCGRVVYN